jgi:hypothetical protein
MSDPLNQPHDLGPLAKMTPEQLQDVSPFETFVHLTKHNPVVCIGEHHGEDRCTYAEGLAVLAMRRSHPDEKLAFFFEFPPDNIQKEIDEYMRTGDITAMEDISLDDKYKALIATCRENNVSFHCVDSIRHSQEETLEQMHATRARRNDAMVDSSMEIMKKEGITHAITMNGVPHFSNPKEAKPTTDMDEMFASRTGKNTVVVELYPVQGEVAAITINPKDYAAPYIDDNRDKPEVIINVNKLGTLGEQHFTTTNILLEGAEEFRDLYQYRDYPEQAGVIFHKAADSLTTLAGHHSLSGTGRKDKLYETAQADVKAAMQLVRPDDIERLPNLPEHLEQWHKLDTQLSAKHMAELLKAGAPVKMPAHEENPDIPAPANTPAKSQQQMPTPQR